MFKPKVDRTWRSKFRDAARGVWQGVAGQSSFVVHLPMAAAVILLAIGLRIPRIELAILLLCIGFVFMTELINSSLESLAKRLGDDRDPNLAKALDIAAGAVLIASLISVLIGLVILGPPFWQMIFERGKTE